MGELEGVMWELEGVFEQFKEVMDELEGVGKNLWNKRNWMELEKVACLIMIKMMKRGNWVF